MKKIIILMFAFLLSFVLSSCDSSFKDVRKEDFLDLKDEKYYIFFHRDSCNGCEMVMPFIKEYMEVVQRSEFNDKRRVYGVNLSKDKYKKIYRVYNGNDGQGPNDGDKDNYIDGITNWEELYVGHTPMLISVTNGRASYVCQGNMRIEEALKTHLGVFE